MSNNNSERGHILELATKLYLEDRGFNAWFWYEWVLYVITSKRLQNLEKNWQNYSLIANAMCGLW